VLAFCPSFSQGAGKGLGTGGPAPAQGCGSVARAAPSHEHPPG